jgi:uncharacterized protein (TIGR00369 family)
MEGRTAGETTGKSVCESSIFVAHLTEPQNANIAGNVHGGVIMRYIDTAAAMVAFRHARMNVVTASIERLDFFNPVFIGNLVKFSSSINMVRRTSMEVGVRVEHHRHAEIPPLILKTDEEIRRNKEAQERRRKCMEGDSPRKT